MTELQGLRKQSIGERQFTEGRYWNCQGTGIAIMAVITEGIDWAAYIGADQSHSEKETMSFVVDYGCKLAEADARWFFNVDLPYRG